MESGIKCSRSRAILLLVAASIFWSTGGLAIKLIPWSAQAIAGVRGLVSGLTLLFLFHLRYHRWPSLPDKGVVAVAVCYATLTHTFVIANKLTTSANAILLQYTAPAWMLLMAAFFLKEKIKMRDVVSVAVIFAGMSMFFLDGLSPGGMTGNLIAVGSGVVMAAMVLLMKNIKTASPMEMIIWGNVFAFIVGLPFCHSLDLTVQSMVAVTYLGVFQLGLAYFFYTLAIDSVSALEAILIPVIEPLLNPIWVFVGTGERPSVASMIGGLIVVVAVVVRNVLQSRSEGIIGK